jgi:hypothetical protein
MHTFLHAWRSGLHSLFSSSMIVFFSIKKMNLRWSLLSTVDFTCSGETRNLHWYLAPGSPLPGKNGVRGLDMVTSLRRTPENATKPQTLDFVF